MLNNTSFLYFFYRNTLIGARIIKTRDASLPRMFFVYVLRIYKHYPLAKRIYFI